MRWANLSDALPKLAIVDLAQPVAPCPLSLPCGEVVRRFTSDAGAHLIPVGDGGDVVAILHRAAFLAAFAGRYSWSLLHDRPLGQWMSTCRDLPRPVTIDGAVDVSAAAKLLKEHPEAGGVLVVSIDGRYVGLVTQEAIIAGMLDALSQARDAALAASEAKSMFLAMMSHEIRTPLTGIIGLSEALLEDPRDAPSQELITLIHSSGHNLLGLINNILDLSRLEAGKLTLDHQPFELIAAVREIVALLGIHAQRKGLELRLVIGAEVPHRVLGDQLRLRQVLTNLVGNAVKFTEAGQVSLIVRPEPPSAVAFQVTDSGPGMSRHTMDHLFQPFVQGDGTPSRRHEGSGLGLAISQRLAGLMGGDIRVDSQEGRGSSFQLTLPLAAIG